MDEIVFREEGSDSIINLGRVNQKVLVNFVRHYSVTILKIFQRILIVNI